MAFQANGDPAGVARGVARVPNGERDTSSRLRKAEQKAAEQRAKKRELIYTPGWTWVEDAHCYSFQTPLHVAEVRHLANPYVRGFDETAGPSPLLVDEAPDGQGSIIWAAPDHNDQVSEDLRWKMNSVSRILNTEIHRQQETTNPETPTATPDQETARKYGVNVVPIQMRTNTPSTQSTRYGLTT
ncbi:MAG: hypothetical protein HOQ05_05485 [Corynebacteriales bacterium]|nr:hypothetical protein [Mycobacteriales bacterium]